MDRHPRVQDISFDRFDMQEQSKPLDIGIASSFHKFKESEARSRR
jgi:hypothetical protein